MRKEKEYIKRKKKKTQRVIRIESAFLLIVPLDYNYYHYYILMANVCKTDVLLKRQKYLKRRLHGLFWTRIVNREYDCDLRRCFQKTFSVLACNRVLCDFFFFFFTSFVFAFVLDRLDESLNNRRYGRR